MIFITALRWFIRKILQVIVVVWICIIKVLKKTKFCLLRLHTCSPNWSCLDFFETCSTIIMAIANSKVLRNFVFNKKYLISNDYWRKHIWEMRWPFSYLFFRFYFKILNFFPKHLPWDKTSFKYKKNVVLMRNKVASGCEYMRKNIFPPKQFHVIWIEFSIDLFKGIYHENDF